MQNICIQCIWEINTLSSNFDFCLVFKLIAIFKTCKTIIAVFKTKQILVMVNNRKMC